MSTFDRQPQGTYSVAGTRAEAGIDQGLRSYMLGVYNYMTLGLALTGFAALATYSMAVSNQAFAQFLFGSNFYFIILFAPLGMVMWLSFRINHMSAGAARTMFLIYATIMGVSLAPIFMVYTHGSIARVFFITAASFGALSLYGYTTKKDLTAMGKFLFMGVIGLLIAMVVNWFLGSNALHFAISVLGVLIFAGLTAYDTQKIKEMYYAGDTDEVATKKSVMGALQLYLDFILMFQFLLSLLGNRE